MNVILDTSVAIAWYLNESCSGPARQWQEKILSGRVHAAVPALHYLEFANVLRTYVLRRELNPGLAAELYALHLEAPLEVMEPPRAELLATALEFNATAYDAAFITLALACDGLLVTAERTTTPWVAKLGKRAVTLG
ncbi:MAG: type II toxin-antitoxin system VapC family toxin [Kiritimatiellae bacterium]|nr:type II toxin-antitoxin system VapC family toxin [Kiritimatiellia bacterium]